VEEVVFRSMEVKGFLTRIKGLRIPAYAKLMIFFLLVEV
jgi:hypothetical protein